MKPFATAHILLDEQGRGWIDDTNVKVIEVALDKIAHGWSAEEIHFQHGNYLSLAQIHAALSYYYDHQAEIDAEIERDYQKFESLRARAQDLPIRQKLRAMGKVE